MDAIQVNELDNVAVAVRPLRKGEEHLGVLLLSNIPAGHKFALKNLKSGDEVRKLGYPIGHLKSAAPPGTHIHDHNLTVERLYGGHGKYEFAADTPAVLEPITGRTFQGFRRAKGRAGTRNYLAVVSTVNCSATASDHIARLIAATVLKDFPNVDGIIAVKHQDGCGLAENTEDHLQLARTLSGYAQHPNISGYLFLTLGCEVAQYSFIRDHFMPGEKPLVLTIQEEGGTDRTVSKACDHLEKLAAEANKLKREPIPLSELALGLNCGASDGFSGITANPALGVAVDMLVAAGGSGVLAETPEIIGAHLMMARRAANKEVAQQLIDRVDWWTEKYLPAFGTFLNPAPTLDNNPAAGNKAGGLSNIFEKAAGAATKGGNTALQWVYKYAERINHNGVLFMDTPGYDPVSVTGLIAGGCNLIAFTTGRGSCFGSKPAPALKIATNSAIFEKLPDDMDFNAGVILDQNRSVREVGAALFEQLIKTASGEKTLSEKHGYGDNEICPWRIGPVM